MRAWFSVLPLPALRWRGARYRQLVQGFWSSMKTDVESDPDYICRKVLNMRLFPDEKTGKSWDLNVVQGNYEVLLVSQFTLYGVLKGNKPDFYVAMPPEAAKPFYASLVEKCQKAYKMDVVKDGVFGAMMKVNDARGPGDNAAGLGTIIQASAR